MSLFDETSLPPVPSPERTDPELWVEELSLLRSLEPNPEPVRPPVLLRRGLNIVSAAEGSDASDAPITGHSVGKSLFLRLIRFCLGEPAYAEPHVRDAIASFLPQGYVTAKLHIAGEVRYVARPLGGGQLASRSYSARVEDDLYAPDRRTSFSEVLKLLSERTVAHLSAISLPHEQRGIRWLDLLAWLTPDQACGQRSHVQWRPGGGNPADYALAVADNHLIVRAAMDLLSPDDYGMITGHQELLSQQGRLGDDIRLTRAVLQSRERDLQSALSRLPGHDGASLSGPLEIAPFSQISNEQAESLERLFQEQLQENAAPPTHEEEARLHQEIGELNARIEQETADLETARNQLAVLEDDAELDRNADMGMWCHLFHTRAEATDHGCPGRDPSITPEVIGEDPQCELLRQGIQQREAALETAVRQRDSLNVDVTRLVEERRSRSRELAERYSTLTQQIQNHRLIHSAAEGYLRTDRSLREQTTRFGNLRRKIRESNEQRREAARLHDEYRRQLVSRFRYAYACLSGDDVAVNITLDGRGVTLDDPSNRASRAGAMRASTVLAFDIACLSASIEGLGTHPRFVAFDSPRDADQQRSLYQRLFGVIGDLERLVADSRPPFQCIITTTTSPPVEFDQHPYVRLRLDARDPASGLLFGRTF